ncbi:PQQ-binding-like beta-propeller repeat protein [Streptosporangium sp. NPDC004379]|uniref:outer membrane protein assembly factor BamB family protein n=1 Tax=Streptosporangium sp. NPDC004379 TaxID=3366189 RepID=UPI0036B9E062
MRRLPRVAGVPAVIRRLAATAVLLLSVLVTAGDLPPVPLPPPGVFTPVWETSADEPGNRYDGARPFAVTGDLILSVTGPPGDVLLRDLRTGRPRAVLRGPAGHRLEGAWPAGDVVVVHRSTRDGAVHRLTGYGTGSGRELWEADVPAALYGGPGQVPADLRVDATPGGVTLVSAGSGAAAGISPRDGSTAWRVSLPRGDACAGTTGAGPILLVAVVRCGHGPATLWAMDPATGTTRWRDTLPLRPDGTGDDPQEEGAGEPDAVEVGRDGTALVSADGRHRLYAPGGRRIDVDGHGPAYGLAVAGDVAAYTVRSPGGSPPVTVAVERDGDVRWRRELPGYEMHDLGERSRPGLAVLQDDAGKEGGRPGPAFLVVADVGRGDAAWRPLPTAASASTLLGAAAGLVLVGHVDGRGGDADGRITAYRLSRPRGAGPAALAGTEPSAWPDACGLLSVDDLRILGPGYSSHPRHRRVGGTGLPRPTGCDYVPPTDDGPAVAVTVAWVAPSPDAARLLVSTALAHMRREMSPVEPRGEGVWLVDGPGMAPVPDSALVGVGGVVVHLSVFGDPGGARKVAGVVARNLRRAHR